MNENYAKQFEPIDGKWKISNRLGAGSFGTVFKIERIDSPGEFSALKIISIPPSEDALDAYRDEHPTASDKDISKYYQGFVDELKKECNLMSKLKGHSNIVSIEDYDDVTKKNGIGCDILIRMELLTPIAKRFREKFPDEKDVIKLGIDICKALDVCKQNNIIHRDIKPSNIFYSPYGDYKLGDFGVARTLNKSSSTASKRGTPNFMAPEMWTGKKYGSNIDTYSLGIVLYKYLNNGNEPFRSENTHTDEERAFERRMKGDKIPAPANGSKELISVVLKACSYNPKDRFASPTQMRTALELVLQGKKNVLALLPEDEPDLDDEETSEKEQTIGIFGNRQVKKEDSEPKEILDDSENDDDKPIKHKPLFAVIASLAVIIIAAIAGVMFSNKKPDIDVNQTTEGISVTDKVDEIESTSEEVTTEESTTEEETTEEITVEVSTDEEKTTKKKDEIKYKKSIETVYATENINIRKEAKTSSAKVGKLKKGDSIKRIAIGDNGWSKVTYKGKTAYIFSEYLSSKKPTDNKPTTAKPTTSKPDTTNATNNSSSLINREVNLNRTLQFDMNLFLSYYTQQDLDHFSNPNQISNAALISFAIGYFTLNGNMYYSDVKYIEQISKLPEGLDQDRLDGDYIYRIKRDEIVEVINSYFDLTVDNSLFNNQKSYLIDKDYVYVDEWGVDYILSGGCSIVSKITCIGENLYCVYFDVYTADFENFDYSLNSKEAATDSMLDYEMSCKATIKADQIGGSWTYRLKEYYNGL